MIIWRNLKFYQLFEMSQSTHQTSCPSCKSAIPLGKFCSECGVKLPGIVTQPKGTYGELSSPVQVSDAASPSIGSGRDDTARQEGTSISSSISSQSVTSSATVDTGVVSTSSQSNACTTVSTAVPTVYPVVVSISQAGPQADVKPVPSTNLPETESSSHPSSLTIPGNEGNNKGSDDKNNKSFNQEKVNTWYGGL